MAGVLLEARPYRPFKSSEEYLYAMKEDLAEWLNMLYSELELTVDNFMDKLETGIVLCKHANSVRKSAEEYVARKHLRKMNSSSSLTVSFMTKKALPITQMGEIHYKLSAKPGTFFARDNVSNFIDFCRRGLEIIECLLFETDDLIMRKNEKNVILCLLEVARRGAKFGMLAPMLVQMEREIDREIAAEQRLARGDEAEENSSEDEEEESLVQYGPIPQIITNDLKSLDEMVRDLVEKCTCPTQFPMIRVSEGKYRIGDTKVLIFVRILRSHVMVRVGGGWDTLSHYLDKHDPCRCRSGHRAALSSKLILKNNNSFELSNAQVHYQRSPPRTRRSSASSSSSGHDVRDLLTTSPNHTNRSRSPTPRPETVKGNLQPPKFVSTYHFDSSSRNRSVSPKRGRSRSPGVHHHHHHRPSYDSPTAASRNRSRSPSVRVSETHKRNNSGTFNDAKSSDIKLQTTLDLADLDLERVQRAKVTLEANEPISSNDDSKQNDSGSEVSDEGYRSLGVIITTPIVGEGKVVVNGQKALKHRLSTNSSIEDSEIPESPSSDCSLASNEEDNRQTVVEDDKSTIKGSCGELRDISERHIRSREPSLDSRVSSPTRKIVQSPVKKSSISSSRSSSPTRRLSDDKLMRNSSGRQSLHLNQTDSSRRRSSKENEVRKMTRSRSASSGEVTLPETSPIKKNVLKSTNTDKSGTWNGKSKKRPGLTDDMFTPSSPQFVRNSVGRSSLGASKTSYSPVTGRRVQSQTQSPTKNMSPILANLLKTKNLNDDTTILLKMKEIINQYSGIFDSASDKKYDSGSEDNLDFTTEWVRNNGSIKRLDGDQDDKSSPSKRKDSKYDGANSKIPAPVFYKQVPSEKEC